MPRDCYASTASYAATPKPLRTSTNSIMYLIIIITKCYSNFCYIIFLRGLAFVFFKRASKQMNIFTQKSPAPRVKSIVYDFASLSGFFKLEWFKLCDATSSDQAQNVVHIKKMEGTLFSVGFPTVCRGSKI